MPEQIHIESNCTLFEEFLTYVFCEFLDMMK